MLSSYVYIRLVTKLFICSECLFCISFLLPFSLSLSVHVDSQFPDQGQQELMPPAVESWSFNHWTSREVPLSFSFNASVRNILWRDDRLGRFRSKCSFVQGIILDALYSILFCVSKHLPYSMNLFLNPDLMDSICIFSETHSIRGSSKTEFLSFGTIDIWN